MTLEQAEKLRVGDVVEIWAGTPDRAIGTITETGYNAVCIFWDDTRKHSIIFLRDAADLSFVRHAYAA